MRSFSREPVPAPAVSWLTAQVESAGAGPFGSRPRFAVVEVPEGRAGGERLGTYGIISGARGFVVCVTERTGRFEDAGYLFERIILLATSRGIGTCWLGGTFDRGKFGRRVPLSPSEIIPAVSPFGLPAVRRRLVDRVIRTGAGSDNRKPWATLFFDGEPGVPLTETAAGAYGEALGAVRRGPSASNRQPWRVMRSREGYTFLLARTPGYGAALGFDIQRLDMGIAMCHFELVARESGLAGRWAPEPEGASDHGLLRVATWVPE